MHLKENLKGENGFFTQQFLRTTGSRLITIICLIHIYREREREGERELKNDSILWKSLKVWWPLRLDHDLSWQSFVFFPNTRLDSHKYFKLDEK